MTDKLEQSKPYTTFINKLLHFDDDVEFVDIIYKYFTTASKSNDFLLFSLRNKDRHPNLCRYANTDQSARIVSGHLRSSIYSSYVKDLYEEVIIYLRDLIVEAKNNAMIEPKSIVGEQNIKMTAIRIFELLETNTLEAAVINEIFRTLEKQKNTLALIEEVCKRLGLGIDKSLIEDAVNYLEIRHILVHRDGKPDDAFREAHPQYRYNDDESIDLTYELLQNMRTSVCKLLENIDQAALKLKLLRSNTDN